ncbi:MAG: hypothetical protein RL647_275 [Bacteroidota bacterium]
MVVYLCGLWSPLKAQDIDSSSIKTDSSKTVAPASKPFQSPIRYEAKDSIVLQMKSGKANLYKEAAVNTDNMELKARYIEVGLSNKLLFARGGQDSAGTYTDLPIFKDGADQYVSDSLSYNSGTKKGKVYGLTLTQDEAHIQLKQVVKQPDGSFMGQSGKLSTCSDPHPHFYLNTSKIKVIPNQKVLFGAANLVFADIPTPLALPFGIAPLQKGRSNGLIMPNPGFNGANNSFYLSNLGYYQGLGKNADAQLNTDLYFNGDFRVGLTTRYLRRYKYNSELSVNMSRFGNGLDRANPEFARSNDFSIISRFGFDNKFLPGTTLNGNINIVSGDFNKRNSRNIQTLSRNEFQSSVNYGRSFFANKVNLSASARHTQNVQTHDFRLELPNVNVGVSSLTPFAKKNGNNTSWYEQIRLSYNLNFTNSLSTKDTLIFSDRYKDVLSTIQSGVRHSIPISTNIKLFKGALNLTPSASYQEKWLFKGQTKTYDAVNKSVIIKDTSGFFRLNSYNISAGLTTNIYGTFTDIKLGKLRAIRHTITPSIAMGYRPEIDGFKKGWVRSYIDSQSKTINYNLFEKSGGSEFGQRKSGSVGFSMGNNLQGKKVISVDSLGKEKTEKFNLIDQLSLNGSYDLSADSFQWSDINIGFNTVLAKEVRIGLNAGYSPYEYKNGRRLSSLYYQNNKGVLRYRNIDFNVNSRITPEMFGGKKSKENMPARITNPLATDDLELRQIQLQPWNYFDFSIPWSLNVTYAVGYNAEIINATQRLSRNALTLRGDISITPEWKISYNTGYDFKKRSLNASEFSLVRNLHCWQLEFMWVPSGYGKQWLFTLRPKSALLQDLKLNKRVYSNPALF